MLSYPCATKNAIDIKSSCLFHWGIAIQITYKLQLLQNWFCVAMLCIFPPKFQTLYGHKGNRVAKIQLWVICHALKRNNRKIYL